MKRKLSGYGPHYNHVLILLIVLIPLIDFATDQALGSRIFLVCFLVAIFTLVLYNLTRLRVVSFDEQFVYVKNFRSTIQLDYSQILSIKKSLGSFQVNDTKSYAAYKIEFLDEDNSLRKVRFYVTDFLAFAAFQQKLFSVNPHVEFKPHGGRAV